MIFLLRHSIPKVDYLSCDYIEANKRVEEYNTTNNVELSKIDSLQGYLQEIFEQEKIKVFASTLPRSLITAKKIFDCKLRVSPEEKFIESI